MSNLFPLPETGGWQSSALQSLRVGVEVSIPEIGCPKSGFIAYAKLRKADELRSEQFYSDAARYPNGSQSALVSLFAKL